MQKKLNKPFFLSVVLLISPLFPSISQAQPSPVRTDAQVNYLAAKAAIDKNDMPRFKRYRGQLDDYPLNIYLDYHANIQDILDTKGDDAQASLNHFVNSPLYSSGRYRYLVNAGKQKRWQDFLTVSPTAPKNISLQCYFHRAQLAHGLAKEAYEGAGKLWLYGRSRPKPCDPLFSAWIKAGHQTQSLIWQRMLLAFDSSQYGLLKYLAKQVTQTKKSAKKLLEAYQDPNRLKKTSAYTQKGEHTGDILSVGLKKLARKDLSAAIKLLDQYVRRNQLSDPHRINVERYIVRRGLIKQDDTIRGYIDSVLPVIKSDDFFERRIRWALREQDNKTVEKYLPLLSQDKRQKSRWQYWLLNQKLVDSPEAVSKALGKQRNFYGFVTATQSKNQIELNHQPNLAKSQVIATLQQEQALARVRELLAINKLAEARAEWVMLLGRQSRDHQTQLGLFARQQGWYDLAVQASIQAKQWNDLNLRFPNAHQEAFHSASIKYNVDIDEIRAIARRESAFYSKAQSGVGARGLMQLMPATAKQTAKKNKMRYQGKSQLFEPQINTQLGSAYYAELLKKFDNNRVLATAAYNAGPHRVTRWLKKSAGKLDVMSFIESIPFKETREYVQAVISYRAIYQAQQQKTISIFSDKELKFKY